MSNYQPDRTPPPGKHIKGNTWQSSQMDNINGILNIAEERSITFLPPILNIATHIVLYTQDIKETSKTHFRLLGECAIRVVKTFCPCDEDKCLTRDSWHSMETVHYRKARGEASPLITYLMDTLHGILDFVLDRLGASRVKLLLSIVKCNYSVEKKKIEQFTEKLETVEYIVQHVDHWHKHELEAILKWGEDFKRAKQRAGRAERISAKMQRVASTRKQRSDINSEPDPSTAPIRSDSSCLSQKRPFVEDHVSASVLGRLITNESRKRPRELIADSHGKSKSYTADDIEHPTSYLRGIPLQEKYNQHGRDSPKRSRLTRDMSLVEDSEEEVEHILTGSQRENIEPEANIDPGKLEPLTRNDVKLERDELSTRSIAQSSSTKRHRDNQEIVLVPIKTYSNCGNIYNINIKVNQGNNYGNVALHGSTYLVHDGRPTNTH